MSTAAAYHHATKYHPETIGQSGGLDWSRQPVPYKEYDCAEPVELAGFLPFNPNPFTGQPAGAEAASDPEGGVTLAALARLLFFTYGITGVVQGQPRPLFLRAAPLGRRSLSSRAVRGVACVARTAAGTLRL